MKEPQEKRPKSWRREREEWHKPENKPDVNAEHENGRPDVTADVPEQEDTAEQHSVSDAEVEGAGDENKLRDERERLEQEEKKWIKEFVEEEARRDGAREAMRKRNQTASESRPEESELRKRDSNMKKTTAFIRKLRNFTEQQSSSIAQEMKSLNLSKYQGEVAAALVEAKLKLNDIPSAVEIASLFHQTYPDFGQLFQENWVKALHIKREEKVVANPSKLRVDLRFYAECITHGIIPLKSGLPLLGSVLTMLVNMDKDSKAFNNISIVLSFCKHCGKEYAGLVPKRVKILSARFGIILPGSSFLPPEKQKNVRNMLSDYYGSLSKHLVESQKELNGFEKQSRKMLMTRGEIPKDRMERGESMKATQAKTLANVHQLADVLDERVPDVPAPVFDDDEESHVDLSAPSLDSIGGREETKDGLWEDDDMRSFYEDLVDLRTFVPSILYRDSEKAVSQMPETEEENLDDEQLLAQAELETIEAEGTTVKAGSADVALKTDGTDSEGGTPGPPGDRVSEDEVSPAALALMKDGDEEDGPNADDDPSNPKGGKKAPKTNAANKLLLEAFLTSLPDSFSRELIDKAAMKFCMEMNTKNNRRKLVRTLFSVPRTRLDLLPFYSRLVATLYPCMPDVANDLAHLLKQEFKYQLRKKDQINIETKVKVVRFIGELVKFRMYPKSEALFCLRMLLFDFRHHNIEMACNLLETTGRYLFRSPDSHPRTKLFLEQMLRKKQVQSLEPRYELMVENAYYYVNPPDTPGISAQEIEDLPPQLLWIKSLVVETLCSSTVEKVLYCFRKIDWGDSAVRNFAIKMLSEPFSIKFYNIRFLAALVGGLLNYHEDVALRVVDAVLDDIRLGLEINSSTKHMQRRVAAVSYLGELFKVRLVDSTVIFNTLYSLITFGVIPGAPWNSLDKPDNLFRLKLTCHLLSICGSFFVTGSAKKKLTSFMLYFQRYYWLKRSHELYGEDGSRFPIMFTFAVEDVFRELTPLTPMAKLFEEAEQVVVEMERELSKQIEAGLPPGVTINSLLARSPPPATSAENLGVIAEENEEGGDEESRGAKAKRQGRKVDEGSVQGDESLSLSEGGQDEDEVSNAIFDGDDDDEERPVIEDDDDQYDGASESSAGEDDEESDYDEDGVKKRKQYQLEEIEAKVTDVKTNTYIDCPENDAFVSAFDKLVSESVLERSKDAVKSSSVVDISVPYHVRSSNKRKTYEQLQAPEAEESNSMKFVLMMRKGNKQQFKDIHVPLDSDLAKNLRTREEVQRAEKEHIKRVTLDINERQEQEDYQEMLQATQRPGVVSVHREKKVRYQHPKGAPDADAIFGSRRGFR